MAKRVRCNVYLDPDDIEKMKKVQQEQGVPVAEQIRRAIKASLKKEAKQ